MRTSNPFELVNRLAQQTWNFVARVSAPRLATLEVRFAQDDAATAPRIVVCTGTPEGAVAAPVGSLALRTDGGVSTTLYVKQSGTGNTGWVAK